MQGDAQQPALRAGVDRQVEHRALHDPVHHPLDLAGGLFQDQEVVGGEEGHSGGLIQIVDYGAHAQIRVDQAWGALPVDDNRGGADDCDQDDQPNRVPGMGTVRSMTGLLRLALMGGWRCGKRDAAEGGAKRTSKVTLAKTRSYKKSKTIFAHSNTRQKICDLFLVLNAMDIPNRRVITTFRQPDGLRSAVHVS